MKSKLSIFLIAFIVIQCKKSKLQDITVTGTVINNTGVPLSSFSDLTVRLYDLKDDQMKGTIIEIGNCNVENNGSYSLSAKNRIKVNGKIQLSLNYPSGPYTFIEVTGNKNLVLESTLNNDFTLNCYSYLERYFNNQSLTNFDSIIVTVNCNNKIIKYKNINYTSSKDLNPIRLISSNKNYLITKIYSSNTVRTRNDTILPNCKSILKDTITY